MKNSKGRPVASAAARRDDLLEILESLAHKLSQPVTSLQGTVEVALMGEMDVKEYRRILEVSLQETQRVAETLEVLRDIVEMERAGIQVRPVSWTETIEKALDEAGPADNGERSRLISDVRGEVWVEASPQRLSLATTRLIGGAVRAAREGHAVRIVLSVVEETACLKICEECPPAHKEGMDGRGTSGDSTKPILGELEKWILSRAIECQGGRLSVRQTFETSRCYEIDLPVAPSPVAGTSRC